VWLVGFYALVFGVATTVSAFRLKGAARHYLAPA
jgi:hypothetical protein